MPKVSSKSDDIDKLLAGVDEKDTSVDSAWIAGGDEGAEEISESVYTLDGGLNGADICGVGVDRYDEDLCPKLV